MLVNQIWFSQTEVIILFSFIENIIDNLISCSSVYFFDKLSILYNITSIKSALFLYCSKHLSGNLIWNRM